MDRPFVVIYLIGVCLAGVLRIMQSRQYLRPEKPQIPKRDFGLMLLWFVGAQVLPMVYGFRPILTFADYPLPQFLSMMGIGIFVLALWLLRQSHVDLGKNWSPIAEIHPEQVLITEGVYRYMRHPMYSAHLLWGVAQGLLLPNWILGWLGVLTFGLFYWVRIPQEEDQLIEHFGQAYTEYKQRVGAVMPRVTP